MSLYLPSVIQAAAILPQLLGVSPPKIGKAANTCYNGATNFKF
jgi:hypothetical protein